MKTSHILMLLAGIFASALFTSACSDDAYPGLTEEQQTVYPRLRIGVTEMSLTATSRAARPMSPDMEKYVRTLAIFEFDNEGLHVRGGKTYHFIDFIAGTVDGTKNVGNVRPTGYGIVDTTLDGLEFESYTNGRICLLANVTEHQIDSLYEAHRETGQTFGRMTFSTFSEWALKFDIIRVPHEVYDDSKQGQLRNMLLFGYYEGPIDNATSGEIHIDLGRMASRLDITVVNETGIELKKRLGYHFDNVCTSAYVFPMKKGMPPNNINGSVRTLICSGLNPDGTIDKVDGAIVDVQATFANNDSHTHYFYMAAHSAKDVNEATKMHLFYNRRITGPDEDIYDNTNSIKIPLCNVHPSEAASVTNGYSLSRNTCYHFTIRLKPSDAMPIKAPGRTPSTTSGHGSADNLTAVAGNEPGEYIVYLPWE